MPRKRENLTGRRFGRNMVIGPAPDEIDNHGRKIIRWWCQCDCGSEPKIIRGSHLKDGSTNSCGCLQAEQRCANGKNAKKYNKYTLNLRDENGIYGIGYFYNTDRIFYFDMDDYEIIRQYCWYDKKVHDTYHVPTTIDPDTRKELRMHQIIFGKHCDHIDRNALNNRRYNLRASNFTDNNRNRSLPKNNTSGVIGVMFNEKDGKWVSCVYIDYKNVYLGRFNCKDDAVIARLQAEAKYYGEFAPQRHLFEKYGITDKG